MCYMSYVHTQYKGAAGLVPVTVAPGRTERATERVKHVYTERVKQVDTERVKHVYTERVTHVYIERVKHAYTEE